MHPVGARGRGDAGDRCWLEKKRCGWLDPLGGDRVPSGLRKALLTTIQKKKKTVRLGLGLGLALRLTGLWLGLRLGLGLCAGGRWDGAWERIRVIRMKGPESSPAGETSKRFSGWNRVDETHVSAMRQNRADSNPKKNACEIWNSGFINFTDFFE